MTSERVQKTRAVQIETIMLYTRFFEYREKAINDPVTAKIM
jgi:hypothetical protein